MTPIPHLSTAARAANAGPAAATATPAMRRVTDAPTRMFHWLFALSFAGAYLTAESERWRALHVTLGYAFAGLMVFRLVYGLLGPRHARLSVLARKLGALRHWLGSLHPTQGWQALRSVNWRQGQLLGMALSIALMLLLVLPLTLSGHATYNDWGDAVGLAWATDALEESHEWLANALLAVVGAHLGLLALMSVLRRQNLALPMWRGTVPGPGPSPVKHNHGWLAALVALGFVAWLTWQWVDAPRGLLPLAPHSTSHTSHASHTSQASPPNKARHPTWGGTHGPDAAQPTRTTHTADLRAGSA